MAFNVTFYTLDKRENSTKQPGGTGSTYSCSLKDGCSILEPIIKLNAGISVNLSAYNYCYIANFARYYWITDITLDRGFVYVACKFDSLASWKSEIGNTDLYVLRSSNTYNGDIIDGMYATKADYIFQESNGTGAVTWWDTSSAGTYIVGLLSYTQTGDVNGGINYIAFSEQGFADFMEVVFPVSSNVSDTAVEGNVNAISAVFTGMTPDQARALAYIAENPFTDYMDSITWIPGQAYDVANLHTGLYMGPNYLTNVQYYTIDKKKLYQFTHTFSSFPKHPQAATRGAYLNTPPYSEYQLILPAYGKVPLDAAQLSDFNYIKVTLEIDLISGQGLYRVFAGADPVWYEIAQFFGNIGVNIKFGENKPEGTFLQQAGGLLSALQAENVGGAISSIGSLMHSLQAPGGSIKGSGGGWIGLNTWQGDTTGYPVLQSVHYYVVDNDLAELGAPLCMVKKPSAIPGFIQAQHGDVECSAMLPELKEIKAFLESGFFYE